MKRGYWFSCISIIALFAMVFEARAVSVLTELADTIAIEEVKVTSAVVDAGLKSVTGSISVLNHEALNAHDPITISQQLNTLPGIYMHSGTFSTNRIVIRGIGSRTPYSSNRIKAYINDIPLTNGDGVTTLEDISVNRLARIEVAKGPNSALYGSGLGGTIKLMTSSEPELVNSSLQYGSFNTTQFKLMGSLPLNQTNVDASVHYMHSDGFRENSRINAYSGFVTADREWKNTDLQFTLFMVDVDAQIPSSINKETFLNTPEKAASNWLAAGGKEKNQRIVSGLTVKQRLSGRATAKTTLFAGASKSFEHRPFNDLTDRSSNYGVRSQMMYHHSQTDIISGVELYTELYNWSTSLDENGSVTTLAQVVENRKYANLFALANYSPLTSLKLSAGLNLNRLNYIYTGDGNNSERFSYPFILSPRFGFNYEASSKINYYGSVGHGFSAPSLEETLMPNGEKNPDLKPETGWMYESGIRISEFNQKWFADACVYYIALDNLLVTKRISEESFLGVNAGKTNHVGVELQTTYQVFRQVTFPGSLLLNVSATLSRNWFETFVDDGNDYTGNKLPGIPAQIVAASLKWNPSKDFTVNIHQNYFGKQFLNDSNSENYAGYSVLNLNLKYQRIFHPKFSSVLTFGVNNLLNKNYASMILVNAPGFGNQIPRYYYPGVPRNFYLSISFQIQ